MKTYYNIKKVIFLAILLIPSLSLGALTSDLKYGTKGEKVVELQEFLIEKGFLNSQPTGNFYSLTLKAVKDYQTSKGLPSTGFVGPITRGAINFDLALNNDAELEETGTITPPTNTSDVQMTQARIDELVQQVKNLIAQHEAQATRSQQQTQILGAIQQNTTPAPPPPPVPQARPSPTPIPIVDKSEILVKLDGPNNINQDNPYGYYGFNVSVLDSNGNYRKDVTITMNAPDTTYSTEAWKKVNWEKFPDTHSSFNKFDWSAPFSYAPETIGTKTITFTAGSLTKSITIEVK